MATSLDRVRGVSPNVAIKAPVRVATTANITLSGEQTIDGVAVVDGDRVLVKDQSTASENGIYEVDTSTWTRAIDFNSDRDFVQGTLVPVNDGSTFGSQLFRLSTTSPTIGGSLSFDVVLEFSGGGSFQPLNVNLTSLSGLTLAANKSLYSTGAGTFALFDLTAVGRTFLAASTKSAQRTALELESAALAALIDDDTMATATASNVASAESTKAYVDAARAAKAVLAAEYASGTTPTQFPSGAWGALELNTERYDGIGVSLASNQITFANAGTYRIVASVNSQNGSGGNRRGQLRAYNVTQAVAAGYGGGNSSQTSASSPTTLDTVITVAASDVVEVQGRADGTALYVYSAGSWGGETGLQVTIERLE